MMDELELDALTEVVNIGVSRAAASLRGMVGEEVLLTVPSVAILSRAAAADQLARSSSHRLIGVRQAFHGEFSGKALLIFPEASSLELVRAVAGSELSLEDIVELEQEALAEIGNIILNSCIATIANLLKRSLTISLPEIVRGHGPELFERELVEGEDAILFIRINFRLHGREISGYLAMVMDLPAIASLRAVMAEFIARNTP